MQTKTFHLSSFQPFFWGAGLLAFILGCQSVKFAKAPQAENASQSDPIPPTTPTPTPPNPPPPTYSLGDSCSQSGAAKDHGFQGSIYYFEQRSDYDQTGLVYDKNNVSHSPVGLGGVDTILANGFEAKTPLCLLDVFVPTRQFTSGFADDNGNLLKDSGGHALIEAFAFDLKTKLQLGSLAPGEYEFALISDDGSILDVEDTTGTTAQTLINNDGDHSTKMKCSTTTLQLDQTSKISLRLRYYQGPKTEIALVLMARKVTALTPQPGTDPLCGTQGADWFGRLPTNQADGYDPNSTTSKYFKALQSGWFVLPSSSLSIF